MSHISTLSLKFGLFSLMFKLQSLLRDSSYSNRTSHNINKLFKLQTKKFARSATLVLVFK
jgi:hypothetical protein